MCKLYAMPCHVMHGKARAHMYIYINICYICMHVCDGHVLTTTLTELVMASTIMGCDVPAQ